MSAGILAALGIVVKWAAIVGLPLAAIGAAIWTLKRRVARSAKVEQRLETEEHMEAERAHFKKDLEKTRRDIGDAADRAWRD